MLHTLEQLVIQESNSQNIQNLQTINTNLTHQINKLEYKVANLDEDIIRNLPQNTNRLEALKNLLSIDYQQLLNQLQALNIQSSQLDILTKYIEKFLQETHNDVRQLQLKIKQLKMLTIEAVNRKCCSQQIETMNSWTNIMVNSLSKKISQLVKAYPKSLNININQLQSLKDLLNEQICTKLITTIYKNAFVYDVPTFSYKLSRSSEIVQKQGKILMKKQNQSFQGQKSQQYYPFLYQTIIQLRELSQKIMHIVIPKHNLQRRIREQIQNQQIQILSTVEFLLPYISIEKRKQIVEYLSRKENQEVTIYDLMVKLRMKGQDGDTMAYNISLLADKIRKQPQKISEIENFLYICQSQYSSLNIAFYICEELINTLEQQIDISHFITLLQIRESIRFQIHHPQ